jgi:hypothetical protein
MKFKGIKKGAKVLVKTPGLDFFALTCEVRKVKMMPNGTLVANIYNEFAGWRRLNLEHLAAVR